MKCGKKQVFSCLGFNFLWIGSELWDDGIGFNQGHIGYTTVIISQINIQNIYSVSGWQGHIRKLTKAIHLFTVVTEI